MVRAARLALSLMLVWPAAVLAQSPDVRVKVDLLASLRYERGSESFLRAYDLFGKPGTVGLSLYLDSGLRAFVGQRVQRPEAGIDRELLDEFYIEDEGIWRIGKQYLPFGYRSIISEAGIAVRGETNLIFEGIPISVAFVDAGRDRQQGGAIRVGSPQWSASALIGQHFGANAASFSVIRRPELAPSTGRGYRAIYGGEIIQRFGNFTARVEGVSAVQPHLSTDEPITVWDASLAAKLNKNFAAEFGYSRLVQGGVDFLRFGLTAKLDSRTTFEPVIRLRNGSYFDAALQVRFKF